MNYPVPGDNRLDTGQIAFEREKADLELIFQRIDGIKGFVVKELLP